MSQFIVREAVLPSGKFAKIRSLTGADYLRAIQPEFHGMDISFVFITMSAIVDDQPVTYADLLAMDLRDLLALIQQVGTHITGPVSK